MKKMKTIKEELFGRITKIDESKGFGFIRSEADGKSYYFKTRSLQNKIVVNNIVVFITTESKTGTVADAIRKVFTNSHGVRFAPRINANHIHLDLDKFLPVITAEIKDYQTDFVEIEHKFTEIVGKTECIPINSTDKIIYAIRIGRNGHSKFVLGREPMDCDSIFCILKKLASHYVIITIYIGHKAGKEPWDSLAEQKDLDFWESNALIYNKELIKGGTETSVCPW